MDDEVFHVYPVNDTYPHRLEGFKCACKPEQHELGFILHNSFDGREDFESGKRKVS